MGEKQNFIPKKNKKKETETESEREKVMCILIVDVYLCVSLSRCDLSIVSVHRVGTTTFRPSFSFLSLSLSISLSMCPFSSFGFYLIAVGIPRVCLFPLRHDNMLKKKKKTKKRKELILGDPC